MEFDLNTVVLILLTTSLALLVNAALVFLFTRRTTANQEGEKRKKWWKEGVIYHIYPRSFQDSNGDGTGDLKGILQRMDYFEYLGVKVLYLSPIFKSPMVDNGYDISDYTEIDPLFGSMADFDLLLAACHKRGLKLVLDFVPNHTSDMHPWFLESRSGTASTKRDWYVWRDPASNGGPPNNWVSIFGGSAWTYDTKTNQYYLHQFYPEQPDLNFRNPEVCQAMKGVLKFWLDKGVDGFRVDAVSHLLEDEQFRDEPTKAEFNPSRPSHEHVVHKYTSNLKGNHAIVQGWREFLDTYSDSYRLLIGEVMASSDVVMKYYGRRKQEFDFPFNFDLLGIKRDFTAEDINTVITNYLKALPTGKWPNWLLGNHDVPRIGSQLGEQYVRAMNVLVLTLPGTAVTYYGEEIGMVNAKMFLESEGDFRDPQRSPMQWTSEQNAGFSSSATPWLPLSENYETVNVEVQKRHPCSSLSLYRELVLLRSTSSAFKGLDFKVVHLNTAVLAYTRFTKSTKYLIVINFGRKVWKGGIAGVKGSGFITIDSEMKNGGSKVTLDDLTLNIGQGLVIDLY